MVAIFHPMIKFLFFFWLFFFFLEFSVMEGIVDDGTKKTRKRQMSRAKRVLANRRERERVRKMNDAFEELRCVIPNYEETRVKTKIELLRIATSYIQSLKDYIQNSVHGQEGHNLATNSHMFPPEFEMESSTVKSGQRFSDHPYPPQFSVPQPPPCTDLPNQFQFPQPHMGQFPSSLSNFGIPESSHQEFCNLLATSLADSHSGESLLLNLQVKKKK